MQKCLYIFMFTYIIETTAQNYLKIYTMLHYTRITEQVFTSILSRSDISTNCCSLFLVLIVYLRKAQ